MLTSVLPDGHCGVTLMNIIFRLHTTYLRPRSSTPPSGSQNSSGRADVTVCFHSCLYPCPTSEMIFCYDCFLPKKIFTDLLPNGSGSCTHINRLPEAKLAATHIPNLSNCKVALPKTLMSCKPAQPLVIWSTLRPFSFHGRKPSSNSIPAYQQRQHRPATDAYCSFAFQQ